MNEIILPSTETGMKDGRYAIQQEDGQCLAGEYPGQSGQNIYKIDPHVFFFYGNRPEGIRNEKEWFLTHADELEQANVDVICLFSGFYLAGHNPTNTDLLGRIFYYYKNILATEEFIGDIHAAGFKVISYFYEPTHGYWQGQSYKDTLRKMDEFAKEYNLDGWYIDGGSFGTHVETFEAFQHLRIMYEAVYLHDSISLVGGNWKTNPYGEMPSVHVRQFCTHTLCNEVLPQFQPQSAEDELWDTYVNDSGIGNTTRSIKWADRSPMSQQSMYQAAAEKGITIPAKRSNWQMWLEWYLPTYLQKRNEYQGE